nr:glycosyltransferase family 61 protein [Alteripontixanthobacter muriae]
MSNDNRAIDLREIVFRKCHAEVLAKTRLAKSVPRATWICERVYDNHSHWLTAHLPKLCLLQDRGALGQVLLPERLTKTMETSLRLLGLDPAQFQTFKPGEILNIQELTIVGSDRFRSELLRPVREKLAPPRGQVASKRVYISRSKAPRRRLLNEDQIWPLFAKAGFERYHMEDLDFAAQVQLMSKTQVLAAPHGAGLTNMIFCPPNSHVLEIAWLGFPNPNFYALACAMGLNYSLVGADGNGKSSTLLERDMIVDPEKVRSALEGIELFLANSNAAAE